MNKERVMILNLKSTWWIWILTFVYSIVAVIQLGNTSSPQQSNLFSNEEVLVSFDSPVSIENMSIFYGIGEGQWTIEVFENGQWTNKSALSQDYTQIFKWETASLQSTTPQVRLSFREGTVSIAEISFYDPNHKLIKPKKVERIGASTSTFIDTLTDESHVSSEYNTYKNSTYFDEIYFVRTAYEHLHELPYYETTHPPLGKLLISFSISIFGFHPFGWRILGTLIGAMMIPCIYFLTKRTFQHAPMALLASFLLAVDFMHFAQTRIGTVDSYLTFFVMITFLFMYRYYQHGRFMDIALSGLFFGLGASTKWVAIYGGIGLCIIFFLRLWKYRSEKPIKHIFYGMITYLLLPFSVYYASFIPILQLPNHSFSLSHFFKLQHDMFSYHAHLVDSHPFSSPWWSWLLDYKPIWYYTAEDGIAEHAASSIVSMGNPLLFWSSIPVLIFCIIHAIQTKHTALMLILISFFSQLLPWVFVSRITFIYHIFAALPFLIILIAYTLLYISNRWIKHLSFVYAGLACWLFILFYPVLSGAIVPDWYIRLLRWFPSWYF